MKRFLLIVVALLAVTLSATHSSAFPLGVYSFLGNKDKVYTQKDSLISWMHSLSYNTNIMEIFPEGMQPDGPVHSELDFSGVLSQMNSNFIDAIVMDRSWKNSDYEHSSYYLTNSNYVMIQAEIFDENAVADYSTNNDNYWYCSNGVINNGSEPIPFAPNPGLDRVGVFDAIGRIAWLCSPTDHVAGYAYGDLKSRWGANPLVYKLFSAQPPPPMHTFPYEQPIFADNDAFYITYHIKIVSPPASPANTPLFYFRVAFYDQNGNVIAIPSVVTGPANTVITDGLLTNTIYSTFPASGDYFDVTAKVKLQDLAHPPGFPDACLITSNNNWTIQSLNPRLFWYDNCTLYLDYIEIEDSMHRDLSSNDPLYLAALTAAVKARVQEVKDLGDNVVGIYTNDEPTQAQFDSFKLMNDMISTISLPMTAVNRRGYPEVIKLDGSVYNHYVTFDNVALPKVTCLTLIPC